MPNDILFCTSKVKRVTNIVSILITIKYIGRINMSSLRNLLHIIAIQESLFHLYTVIINSPELNKKQATSYTSKKI